MKINLIYDSTTVNATTLGSADNLKAFEGQVNAAAKLFEATYLDPVTVNITVKYGPTDLAESRQEFNRYSLSTVKDALKKDITSLDDLKTVDVLGSSSTVYLTHAQLKALGIIAGDAPGSDGTITFSDTPGLIDFSHSSKMSATSYDLFGAAAHEISEIMGRVVDVTFTSGAIGQTALTQFDSSGSFTIGSETLLKFNTAATGDRGDWDSSVSANDAFRAFATPGVVSDVSKTDLRSIDVVGWDHRASDLVFAIDTTGSMSPYIGNVKTNAVDIVNRAFGTDTAPVDARIGIVGFKDAAGPNGPGENTAILKFTEQDSYEARKTAAINAINSITVGGGGDIPEGDNSALLYALQGNLGDWRRAAQDHKIILFTDAPIKDTGLADQVAAAAAKLGVTVESSTVTSHDGVAVGDFTFTAPGTAILGLDSASVLPGGDSAEVGSVIDGPTPATISFTSQVYAIQVGSDSTATDGLTALSHSTGGKFFTGDSGNLSDIIKSIIDLPPPLSPINLAHSTGPDFNADGFSDVLLQNTNGQAGIWEMNGTSISVEAYVGPNPGTSWKAIGTGDFNGDGKSDILWQDTTGQVGIWELDGSSIITYAKVGSNPGSSWHAKETGDYNGDGKSDILFQHTTGQVGIWELDGTNVIGGVGTPVADAIADWLVV